MNEYHCIHSIMIEGGNYPVCALTVPSLPGRYANVQDNSKPLSIREISEQRPRSNPSPISTNDPQRSRHVRHSAQHLREEQALGTALGSGIPLCLYQNMPVPRDAKMLLHIQSSDFPIRSTRVTMTFPSLINRRGI